MGYSIYYDRAFIRVDDKYVPLVNSGASNSANMVNGRLVADKDWHVLNWKRRDRVLFSEAEIRDIAKDYEQGHQENGMSFRSRNKPFAPGDFEKWIVEGMSRARSIEEYLSFGNKLYVVDYPDGMANRWRKQAFSTDEELLGIIKQFGAGHEHHISFGNSREVFRSASQNQGNHRCGAGQPEGEKPSVLGLIAEAREDQRRANTERRGASSPGRKKAHSPEL